MMIRRLYLWIVHKGTTFATGRHIARGDVFQAFDDGGFSGSVVPCDESKGREERDGGGLTRVGLERAYPPDQQLC